MPLLTGPSDVWRCQKGQLRNRKTHHALIASVGIAMPAEAHESAIPNFTSTNFGWLLDSGFDFLPIEGKVVPVGPDPTWRGGIGLPRADFNYQPPEAGSGPRLQSASRIGPWKVERPSDAENPNLKPWAAAQIECIMNWCATAVVPSARCPAAGLGAVRANCSSGPCPSISSRRRTKYEFSGSGTISYAASISAAGTARIRSRAGRRMRRSLRGCGGGHRYHRLRRASV